ncbi:hypothetical protein ACHAW5_001362 [Stephanodiscus triporus]|uniref:Nudix hydrolase domain-containing protein n=1 Tax=Stephanodiscus triporus TaxID=2934178 RepID=A0ABD3P4G6_9STRA
MVSLSIKRVVSVFILRPNEGPRPVHHQQQQQVALFRRCATMPTFPGHWAGISGSIEDDDANPLEAALRELLEETNLAEIFGGGDDRGVSCLRNCIKQGLHVDISSDRSGGAFGGRIIRVYPFALTLPACRLSSPAGDDGVADILKNTDARSSSMWSNLEMKGTEHDEMKIMTIEDFLDMMEPCVPALKLAFHHATLGSYLNLPEDIRTWERDRVNGAAFLARQALTLAAAHTNAGRENTHNLQSSFGQPSIPHSIAMLRPSMVPIVNLMNEFDRRMQTDSDSDRVGENLRQSLDEEIGKCVDLGFETIMRYYAQWTLNSPSATVFAIGTFSRSSTVKKILERLQEESNGVKVLCSQSTPGDEGELMAADVPGATLLSDQKFRQYIEQGKIELVIVGADCILQEGKGIVNKIGTASLSTYCKQKNIPLICCADRWKVWEDVYPPGLEDIFELFIPDKSEHVLIPDCRSKTC